MILLSLLYLAYCLPAILVPLVSRPLYSFDVKSSFIALYNFSSSKLIPSNSSWSNAIYVKYNLVLLYLSVWLPSLSTTSIIVIVVSSIVIAAIVVVFIKLRTRMKVK